jgi:hypothetical protein
MIVLEWLKNHNIQRLQKMSGMRGQAKWDYFFFVAVIDEFLSAVRAVTVKKEKTINSDLPT